MNCPIKITKPLQIIKPAVITTGMIARRYILPLVTSWNPNILRIKAMILPMKIIQCKEGDNGVENEATIRPVIHSSIERYVHL